MRVKGGGIHSGGFDYVNFFVPIVYVLFFLYRYVFIFSGSFSINHIIVVYLFDLPEIDVEDFMYSFRMVNTNYLFFTSVIYNKNFRNTGHDVLRGRYPELLRPPPSGT